MQAYRMKRRNYVSLAALKGTLLAATLFAAPAFAQTATADGATQLQDTLSKTFGKAVFDKGILSVAPQGSAYAIKIDFNPAVAELKEPGITVSADPIVYLATPNADGTYGVTSDSPIHYSFSSTKDDKPVDVKFAADGCKSTGVFDPKILAFSNLEASCPGASLTIHSPEQDAEASYGVISSKLTGEAGGSGGTTINMTGSVADFVETISLKDKDTPMAIKIAVKSIASDATFDNAQLGTLFEFAGMAAKAGDPTKLIAEQDDIKQKLLAALPLWNNLGGKAIASGISVDTPIGTVKLDTLEETLGITGAVKDASYAIGIKYAGLQLPESPIIPKWVTPLVPAQGNIDLKFSGVDLDALARLAIQNFDATQDPPIPESLTPQFLTLVMGGQPHVTLSPSTFTASAGAVSAEGTMSVFPSQKGKVTVSATNLDNIVAAINSADVPNKDQAMMGIALIKGLAKTGADGKAVWDVDFDAATKAVSVNGQVLSAGGAGGGDE